MSISEITHMELLVIKEALERTLDEFEAIEDDGFVLNSGAREAIDESLVIVNALINRQDKEYIKQLEESYPYE